MLVVLRRITPVVVALAGLTASAAAGPARPAFRADGSVVYQGQVFANHEAWYRSPAFAASGLRCGSEPGPQASFAVPSDCSFSHTTISAEYDDARVIVIPVVFHVIQRSTGEGAISAALIQSQIDILNEDFRALAGTPGAMGNDARVEFVLARFDAAGNPTTGIDTVTNNTYFQDPGPGASNPMKQALHWDTTRFLNIYTNDANGGLLGYATFPQEDAGTAQDGVVLLWSAVGRDAPAGPPYDQGRTATHEVGHYLGLFHTFQDGCGSAGAPYDTADLIADTQPEANPHFSGCTAPASACGGGADPIENYMDYSDDACMTKFTAEQNNRIRCSIVNYRSVNTKPTAAFTASTAELAASFTSTSTDAETAAGQLHYQWTFGDGATATTQNPTHTYATAGTYTVTLEVVDPGSAASTASHDVTVSVGMPDAAVATGADADPGDPGDDDGGGGGGGCCQTGSGGGSAAACAMLVLGVLARRRRR